MNIALDIRRIHDFGVGTYIRNLVRRLARQDRTNRYLLVEATQSPPGTDEGDLESELEALPENFSRVTFRPGDQSLRNHLQFQFLLRAHRIELLHVPHLRVPLLVPCRYVVTVHDLADFFFPTDYGFRSNVRFFLGRRALAGAARVLAVSQATRRDVALLFGVPAARIEVVYNAIDDRLAEPGRQEESQRTLERYGVRYPFLLYAGSVKPQKNVVRLIEAFAAVKGELGEHAVYRDLKLIVIGDEPSKNPDLRRAAVRCRIEQEVRFLGFVPVGVLRVFYRAAEAFVFPSLYEGFGLPPLEAMAQGTPVVVSTAAALPEAVGQAALMVNPENVFDIARGIRRVLLEPATGAFLRRRGLEQVNKFSWERSVERVLQIYNQVGSPTLSAVN